MNFKKWWTTEAGQYREAGKLLTDMTDWNPAGIKALAEAAYEAGRRAGITEEIQKRHKRLA